MRDEMILRKIRKRDPSGLEDLMDRYIPYVSTIVWNILRNCCSKEDAEEVVSDVFVTAWQKAGDVLPGALKAWLGAVARNKAKTRLRSGGGDLPLEEDILEIPAEETPEGMLERSEEQKRSAGQWTACRGRTGRFFSAITITPRLLRKYPGT